MESVDKGASNRVSRVEASEGSWELEEDGKRTAEIRPEDFAR